MRPILAVLPLALLCTTARSEPLSAEIAQQGLAKVEARLPGSTCPKCSPTRPRSTLRVGRKAGLGARLGWAQGWAVLPYLDKGTVVDTTTLDAFVQVMQGQAVLFALYLN